MSFSKLNALILYFVLNKLYKGSLYCFTDFDILFSSNKNSLNKPSGSKEEDQLANENNPFKPLGETSS
jgi:hypothetical protein